MKDDIENRLQILWKVGKYQEIIQLIEKLPQSSEMILLEKVRAYRQLGEYKAGLEIIDKLVTSTTQLIQIYALREKSHILYRQTKYSAAEEILNKCKNMIEHSDL